MNSIVSSKCLHERPQEFLQRGQQIFRDAQFEMYGTATNEGAADNK